ARGVGIGVVEDGILAEAFHGAIQRAAAPRDVAIGVGMAGDEDPVGVHQRLGHGPDDVLRVLLLPGTAIVAGALRAGLGLVFRWKMRAFHSLPRHPRAQGAPTRRPEPRAHLPSAPPAPCPAPWLC